MAVEPRIYRLPARHDRRLGVDAGAFVRELDYVLLACVAGLIAYGLWLVQTITQDDVARDPDFFFLRQSIFAGVGVLAMVGMAVLDPEVLRRRRNVLYGVALALLVVVFLLGPSIRGSRRWIDLLGKNDRHVARSPAHLDGGQRGRWVPGHTKWDYGYSLGQLRPDLTVEIGWDGSPVGRRRCLVPSRPSFLASSVPPSTAVELNGDPGSAGPELRVGAGVLL